MTNDATRSRPQRTAGSLLAFVCAVGSFVATFTANPVWGLVLAMLAVPFGLYGLVRAISPRKKGGVVSFLSLILAVLAFVVAIVAVIGIALV